MWSCRWKCDSQTFLTLHSLSSCSLSLSPLYFFLSVFGSLFFIPSTVLMLFQVFYMYSITTKNKYLSGDISCCMLCLLAVFIAYTPQPPSSSWCVSMSWLPTLPPPDVFQAVPEKPQWDCRQTEQSSNPRSRLQHQGHGQWQLHVQVRPHAHWW